MKLRVFIVTLVVVGYNHVEAEDPFEGGSAGADCYPERKMEGCVGPPLSEQPIKTRGVGINKPNTLVFLFTKTNNRSAEYLHLCGGRLPNNTNFNSSHRTEIFVHGWLDGACRTVWMRECKHQLFLRGDFNVILIDWTWGNTIDYQNAATNSPVVGEQIALVVKNIMEQTGVTAASFHVIGHSMGAHIAGFVGQEIKGLRRITGLDPAYAPFRDQPLDKRLDPSDAELVDIIHSNAGSCAIATNIGYDKPLGHADFYPNGGQIQLSCIPYSVQSLLKLDYLYGIFSLIPTLCSHLHSVQYYKVSINPGKCQFVGVECPNYESFQRGVCRSCGVDGSNCAVMGMDFYKYPYKKDGNFHSYYLNTLLQCPYCDNSNIRQLEFLTKNITTPRLLSLPEILQMIKNIFASVPTM